MWRYRVQILPYARNKYFNIIYLCVIKSDILFLHFSRSVRFTLRQRVWHSKITQYLHQIGFRMSKSDNSLYIRSDYSPIFIILNVDDLVIGGEHLVDINMVKSLLSSKFEMTDMKELHYFLGIEVIRTPAGIMISQRQYILNLLYKFGMTYYKSVPTPLDLNLKLDDNSGTTECEPTHYRQLVGSLIYLTITQFRPQLFGWPP